MEDSSIPDWISSIAAAVGAVAIVFGLFRADKKVDEVQTNTRLMKRSEVAEELIALALSVEDAMKDIRNPFDSIPQEKIGDKKYPYQKRYDRIVKYNELFQRLRDAQIRERAIIGDVEVREAVDQLFSARGSVAAAIETLADYADDEPTPDDREHRKELRSTIYGSFSERDELGKKISQAVETIESRLRDYARMEVQV